MIKVKDFLEFLANSQKLKKTLRHCWTEDIQRQESSAEHTWHMSVMAITLVSSLQHRVDLLKVLKLVAVHDLGEALTGDIPAFLKTHDQKYSDEEEAIREIVRTLPRTGGKEIIDLYREYKEKKSAEAGFVKMLDIIDVLYQHLVSDISTWCEEEMTFNVSRIGEKYFLKEPLMMEIFDEIHRRLAEKLKNGQTAG